MSLLGLDPPLLVHCKFMHSGLSIYGSEPNTKVAYAGSARYCYSAIALGNGAKIKLTARCARSYGVLSRLLRDSRYTSTSF